MTRSLSAALLLTLVLVIGWTPVAHAKDVQVILGPVAAGTGSVTCYALNVGNRSIETIVVRIMAGPSSFPAVCSNVESSAGPYSLCSRTVTGPDDYWCRVEITGGRAKDVVSRLNVEDADGNTILSLRDD